MRKILLTLWIAASLGFASVTWADVKPANPFGLFYDASFENIDDYMQPGALLVTGNCNRYDPHFEKARAAGADVVAYLNIVEVYDHSPCRLSDTVYMGTGSAPLWPYPKYGQRVNYKNTHLTDLRAGSKWSDFAVEYISNLMREGKVDGVFLDNIGARLYSKLADWRSWDKKEQDEWTLGNVDFVRRLDEARRQIDPDFLIITNGYWDRGDSLGLPGERHVDGVVLEHPKGDDWHVKYAARNFSDLGHRRVLVIAHDTPEDTAIWDKAAGVTHVTLQPSYHHANKPALPFRALEDRRRKQKQKNRD
jgi:hypothetical protein